MRWIFAVVGLLVAIAIAAAFYLLTNLNAIVESAVETYGSEITGTRVSVGSVDISLADGRGTLRGVTIANPPGYESKTAFSLGEISVDIDPASVTGNPIVIDAVTIAAPQVTYELGEGLNSNIQTILDNIDRYSAANAQTGDAAPAETAGEETRLRIARFTFRDGKVAADTRAAGGKQVDVKLPPLEMKNVGGSGGAPAGAIGSQVLDAYANSVVRAVAGKQVDKLKKKGTKKAIKALEGLLD